MTMRMDPLATGVLDAAVAEVKTWLRIELGADDAELTSLTQSAFAYAEDFCGQVLIARTGTETLPMCAEWRRMSATPVRSLSVVNGLPAEGASFAIAAGSYAFEIDASGDGWIQVMQPGAAGRISALIIAGLADDWPSLPDGLRQGIVRLAAHMFAERASDRPPAIVTALWWPWRRMRLA
ncbi:MAG: phage head-tail connector protein [Sphingobium sp.]